MAFTPVIVTRDYDLADGTDPTGTVTFTPTAPMVNGTTVVAAPVVGKLDVDGILTIDLVANTDPATVPTGVSYLVKEYIGGAARSYYVTVPHDAGPALDLSTLDEVIEIVLPAATTWAGLLAGKQPLATLLTRLAAAPVAVTYAASITLNAALGCVHRVSASGSLAVSDIVNGADGQTVTLEVLASGADRTITVTASPPVTVMVSSGSWWSGTFRYNAAADIWLLV